MTTRGRVLGGPRAAQIQEGARLYSARESPKPGNGGAPYPAVVGVCYNHAERLGNAQMPPKSKTVGSRRGRKAPAKRVAAAPAPTPKVSAWAARGCAAAVFLAVFLVYLRTLLPTVLDQDSGELVSAAHVLGVPHPTGYPMWTLLARLFDCLPLGHTSAYRVGMLSAVSVALAAGLITWVTVTLSGAYVAGVFSGLAFGFWLPTWSQAVIAEVYGLEGLLIALFLVAFWWWDRERTPGRLGWVALAAGVAAAHHRTGALVVLPALAVAFAQTRPVRVMGYLKAAACAAAPFLLYLYLPIRAAARPAMNWGNPDSWERFLDHASGHQYSALAFAQTGGAAMKQAGKLLGESLAAPGWPSYVVFAIGLALIAWGIGHLLCRRLWATGSLVVGSAVLVVFILYYGAADDSKVWLIPAGAVLAIFGGVGMGRFGSYLPGKFSGSAVAALLGVTTVALLLSANWSKADQSNKWGFRDAWVADLAPIERNAILVTDVDMALGVATYLQVAEGRGRGVTVLCPLLLVNDWYLSGKEDKELREVAGASWEQAAGEFDVNNTKTRDYANGVARFAALLAQHYRGRRAVYSPRFPVNVRLQPPPYYVGLRDTLFRLDFAPPSLQRPGPAGAPLAVGAEGVKLVGLIFSPAETKNGDLLCFRARWQLERPLPGLLFALRLVSADAAAKPAWEKLLTKACLSQGYPVLHGVWGLAPSAPGTVYEQTGQFIVPSNTPPGEYRFEISFSPHYPPSYETWAPLEGVGVRIGSRE